MQIHRRIGVIAILAASLGAGGMLALSACGGGTHAAACGPGTCMGCCDSAGICQTGVLDTQCGRQGAACEACPASTACNLGICAAPQSCSGCTDDDGSCAAGTSESACGGNAEACVACGSNELCVNRACQKTCKDLDAQCENDIECCTGRCSLLGFCSKPVPDAGTEDGGEVDPDGGSPGDPDGGEVADGGEDGGSMGCGDPCVAQPGPMATTCNPCAAQICGFIPSCCTTAWDSTCASAAGFLCNGKCGSSFDAGFPNLDAGFPGFDGGFPSFDAGIPKIDAGFPNLDGGFPGFDGGFP